MNTGRETDTNAENAGKSQTAKNGKTATLRLRYLVKLAANVAAIPLFLIMEMILPRALGPATYGNFSFAVSVFEHIVNFFDLRTSTCLNNSLAKRPDEFGLVSFYARFSVLLLIACLALALFMCIPAVGGKAMPGVPLWLVLPAALWAYLTWAGRMVRGINDALGLTVRSEMARMGINMLAAGAILGLFLGGALDLKVFFAHQYFFLLLSLAGFCLSPKGSWPGTVWKMSRTDFLNYAREFKKFCGPLFIIALASLFALCLERWMLQFFEGSVEQGYFSLSQKIGMACFLFITAMTPLLMRELAVAHGKKDIGEMIRLLDKFAPMLYSLAAWFSCFAVLEATSLTRLFGGAEFGGAVAAVQIMAFYPVHQTYAQVAAAVHYATGETRAFRNLTLIALAVGVAYAWVGMAPEELGGYSLGAQGLAIKMVGVQILAVNMLLIAARRLVPFNYSRNLAHQIICPALLFLLAFAAREGSLLLADGGDFSRLFYSGIIYFLISAATLFMLPFIFGTSRQEIISALRRNKG